MRDIGFWQGILETAEGRGEFRLIVQPVVSIVLGIRLGIADAKEGKDPFFKRQLFSGAHRGELAKETARKILIPFLVAFTLDGILQYLTLGHVRPLAAVVVGLALIFVPFSIARALTNRFWRRSHRHDKPKVAASGAVLVLIVAATMVLGGGTASADDCCDADAARVLAGHRFVPSMLVPWGFIDSSVASDTSFAFSTLDLDLDSAIARTISSSRPTHTFLGFTQTFSGTVRLAPWLGLSLRAGSGGLIPDDKASGIIVGAHETVTGEAGLSIGLVRLHDLQITARGDAGYTYDKAVIPAQLPDSPQLTGHASTVRASLIAAFALAPYVGIQASGSYAWQWLDVSTNESFRTLDGAVAATFGMVPFPVTLLVGTGFAHDYGRGIETLTTRAILGPDTTKWRGEAGLFYTGRRDLELGASFTADLDGGSSNRRLGGVIRFGYYF